MKKAPGIKIIIYSLIILLSSCVASGNLPRLTGSPSTSGVQGKEDFVELNDGKIIEGKISKNALADKIFGAGGRGSITVNNNQYNYDEIKSYQRDGNYYLKADRGKLMRRLVHGKINLYVQMINHAQMKNAGSPEVVGSSLDPYYYLQKGDEGKAELFSIKILRNMVKDYSPALEWMDKYKALSKKEKRASDYYFDKAIEVYNSKS